MNNPASHTIHLYGIPNCDTVKKARAWFAERGAAFTFHDFKKEGVTLAQLQGWAAQVGADRLLNRQGTTWRKLDPQAQARAATPEGLLSLLTEQVSAIKRPVVELHQGGHCTVTIGMQPDAWQDWLAAR